MIDVAVNERDNVIDKIHSTPVAQRGKLLGPSGGVPFPGRSFPGGSFFGGRMTEE